MKPNDLSSTWSNAARGRAETTGWSPGSLIITALIACLIGSPGCSKRDPIPANEPTLGPRAAGLDPEVFASSFVLDGDRRLHLVRGGPPTAEVVVLLPGWPQTWYAWRKVMPELAGRYHVLAVDPPGTGDSAIPKSGYDTDTVANHIREGLAAAGVRAPIHLVAHDIGTWVAFSYGHRFPRHVKSMILMDAAVPGLNLEQAFTLENAPRLFQFFFNAVEELPELLTDGKEREFLEFLFRSKSLVPGAISDHDLDIYARSYARPGRMKAGFEYYRAVPTSAEQNREAQLPMPVLALGSQTGVRDSLVRALRSGPSPHADGGTLEGSGHYMPEERPGEVIERIVAFIEAHRSEADQGEGRGSE